MRASVGIILNGLDLSGNIELVALEVDHTVFFSVTAATMTNGDSAVGVAAGLFCSAAEAENAPEQPWTEKSNR